MNGKKIFLFLNFLIFLTLNAYSQINVVNPIEGKWANKQMLVIDTASDKEPCDYYYSVDGSDPELFGFAYDEPVLLELTGNITLKIVKINQDNSTENKTVKYTVKQNPASMATYHDFIQSFYESGIINYPAGTTINLPQNLEYSTNADGESFFSTTEFYLHPDCVLTRYVPVTAKDLKTNQKWRFIVRTIPPATTSFSRTNLPFEISDWKNISFFDNTKLYKIDNGKWRTACQIKNLDRTVSHIISWRDAQSENGIKNLSEFIVLPPKPVLKNKILEDGAVLYSIQGDESYTLGVLNPQKKETCELYKQVSADVFYGEKCEGNLKLGVFSSSVYQGELEVSYKIDKRPPQPPSVLPSESGFYLRKNVQLDISCENDSKSELFVSVSGPFVVKNLEKALKTPEEYFKNIKISEYQKISSSSCSVILKRTGSAPVFYKISSYTKKGDAISKTSDYSVIIDSVNFYFDGNAKSSNVNNVARGSVVNPFSTFDECLEAINSNEKIILTVSGKLVIPKGNHKINSNVSLNALKNAEIIFSPGASLTLNNSDFKIKDCTIKNDSDSKYENFVPLFNVQDSVLGFENSVFSVNFSKNANIFNSSSSELSFSDCLISLKGKTYATCFNSANSKIQIERSTITSAADTALIFSTLQTELSVKNSILSVFGKNGFIGELSGGNSIFEKNEIKVSLSKKTSEDSYFYTSKNAQLKEIQNEYSEN